MQIVLNGEPREVRDGLSLADLLADLGLASRRVAVELNRAVVARPRYAEQALQAGDEVEIVQFVGGG